MSSATQNILGSVVSLWRYPVKSMLGEELEAVSVGTNGLAGDRAYALIDAASGKVVSAKNPKKWPDLFAFRAATSGTLAEGPPRVEITLPNGATVSSTQTDSGRILSDALGREVTLETTPPDAPTLEEYWPDMEDLDHRDTVTDEAIPGGTFFDGAPVHLLTTLLQGDLPKDPGVLRAAIQGNEAQVGVYASVLQGGTVRRGDSVSIVE